MNISIKAKVYHFIDNLNHIIPIEEIYACEAERNELLEKVKEAFKELGWEGDGQIGLIWLPPFVLSNDDGYGKYIWHVKQSNNGTSFLGDIEYGYEDIYVNDTVPRDEQVTITKLQEKNLISQCDKYRKHLCELEKKRNEFINPGEDESESLFYITLEAIQNNIVASFTHYVDEIYLVLLKHVMDGNVDRLKLSKMKANLPLDVISKGINIGDDMHEEYYVDQWLTLQNIIGALWTGFKFMNFNDKLGEICRSVDFNVSFNKEYSKFDLLRNEILKHVDIRNSIQHHDGELDIKNAPSSSETITVLDDDNKAIKIKQREIIKLSIPEVNHFIDCVSIFAKGYEEHINARIKERRSQYISF